MPWGYAVEPTGEIDRTGKAVMRRIPDEATLTTAEQIAERIASGSTPGAVARWLNAERVRTRRGGTWSTRSVRDWIRLAALIGEDGYPALLDRELWLAANAQLKRLDPVAVAGRSGGRPPADDSFILRQVARCARCGRPLWTRSYESGRRAYVCSAVREARGTCDAERIPAPEVERVVIEHLNQFVGEWGDFALQIRGQFAIDFAPGVSRQFVAAAQRVLNQTGQFRRRRSAELHHDCRIVHERVVLLP